MTWIVVQSFSFPYEAQIAKTQLEAAEIPAFIENEHTINMDWLYSNALGGVRILVPESYAEEAKALLAQEQVKAVLIVAVLIYNLIQKVNALLMLFFYCWIFHSFLIKME